MNIDFNNELKEEQIKQLNIELRRLNSNKITLFCIQCPEDKQKMHIKDKPIMHVGNYNLTDEKLAIMAAKEMQKSIIIANREEGRFPELKNIATNLHSINILPEPERKLLSKINECIAIREINKIKKSTQNISELVEMQKSIIIVGKEEVKELKTAANILNNLEIKSFEKKPLNQKSGWKRPYKYHK